MSCPVLLFAIYGASTSGLALNQKFCMYFYSFYKATIIVPNYRIPRLREVSELAQCHRINYDLPRPI